MPAPPVVNASPLIVLAKAGQLAMLRLAGDPVLVPRAVVQEISIVGPSDPAAKLSAILTGSRLSTRGRCHRRFSRTDSMRARPPC